MVAALCSFAATVYALDPRREMSQYVSESWGAEQGFPPGPVYAITQTPDGYLWMGTQAGLARFDGWSLKLLSGDAVPTNDVLGVTPGDRDCLWIRRSSMAMTRYCGDVFDAFRPGSGPLVDVSAMARDQQGEILLWQLDVGAFSYRDGVFRKLVSADELPRSPVTALARTPDGDLWIGTRDAGLFRVCGGKTIPVRNGLPDPKINCLFAAGDRDLWVGTDGGIVRWDGAALTAGGLPSPVNRYQALVIAQDQDGNVWVGSGSHGLVRFNGLTVEAMPDEGRRNPVTAIFEDRQGNLWIGRSGSIQRICDSAFVTYSSPEGLPTDGSNPVFVDATNRMWFPPVSGGLWWSSNGKHGRVTAGGLDRDVVYSMDGRDQVLWMGRQHGGLTRLDTANGKLALRTYTKADGLAENSVYSVLLARDGSVWAGTLSGGVSVLRHERFTTFTSANGLASNTVASILESRDGAMWFATPSGLSKLSGNRWRTYSSADGLPSEDVNCLFEDAGGVLWAGTESGIAFLDHERFEIPNAGPQPLHSAIYGIAQDKYGALWMSTAHHVLRAGRDALMRGPAENDVREYSAQDGLRGAIGVKRHRSVVTGPDGRIWISLDLGISVVDPARLARNSARPAVHVQSVLADGNPRPMSGTVRVPAGSLRVAFNYVGIDLSAPARVIYRYRLDGYDREWSAPIVAREVSYTNLTPGPYRFRVMAADAEGLWSSHEDDVQLRVDPLLWQNWWFQALGVLFCGLSVFGLYRLRLLQMSSRLNFRFQERLAERTRIAQELHDTLLQGFLSASMQVHVAASRLPDDSSVKPALLRAQELMRKVIDEGRNAVKGLRSPGSAGTDLATSLSKIQDEMAATGSGSDQTEFRVIVVGQPRELHPVLRDEVYRIAREALVNAFRHAYAKRIEIEFRYSAGQFQVFVRDDGRGIDTATLRSGKDGHFGLPGMRERAENIGAKLHLFSAPGAGTELELDIPGRVAFGDRRESWPRWFHRFEWLSTRERRPR